jgi:indole-3-glycerol phosphate synthase
MNILDTIIAHKKQEVAERKLIAPATTLEKQALYNRRAWSLKAFLSDKTKTGIIAEFKRKSPSRGIINDAADVVAVTKAYTNNGAAGLSVLTDKYFFGGSAGDLIKARVNEIPILRKEFVIDEYQVVEARAMGADAVLLIAACLTPAKVRSLAAFAKNLELEVLLELHAEEELEHICTDTEIIGINNRNLKTFEVNIERSLRMAGKIPFNKIKVAESGISSVESIRLFKENGFNGFLIGENFMKEKDPAIAFAEFVQQLKENSV